MSGLLVQQGATVVCPHGGLAMPTVSNPRVTLGGGPVGPLSATWTVAGCTLPAMRGGPCVTATWSAGTVRVRSSGQPIVVQGGTATCVPTGAPLQVAATQRRVTAS